MKNLMLAVMMVAGSLISVAGYSQDKQMDPEASAKKVTEKMAELSMVMISTKKCTILI